MKIAILGAGAMGMLFGGYLSKENEVVLIDIDQTKVEKINKDGIRIHEPDGTVAAFHPRAALSAGGLGEMDLVIIFVKSMDSKTTLTANQRLIGQGTLLMSLQNGCGHDSVLKQFAALERIVIGTTQHNSSIIEPGAVRHGGGGKTCIGSMTGDGSNLGPVAATLNRCGIQTGTTDKIKEKIWEKLFINASASALTAVLQTRLGFLAESGHAWRLVCRLIREAVAVANGDGMSFDEDEIRAQVRGLLERAKDGYTSIYADIRDGRRTEVDSISGAVVAAGRRNGVPAPGHEFVVSLIHAMEDIERAGRR